MTELCDQENERHEFATRGHRGGIGARSLPEHQDAPDRGPSPEHHREPSAMLRNYHENTFHQGMSYARPDPERDTRIEELLDRGYHEVDFYGGWLCDVKTISGRLFVYVEWPDEPQDDDPPMIEATRDAA